MLQATASNGEAQAALQRGDNQAALDHYRDAITAYTDALKLSPTNVEAMAYREGLGK